MTDRTEGAWALHAQLLPHMLVAQRGGTAGIVDRVLATEGLEPMPLPRDEPTFLHTGGKSRTQVTNRGPHPMTRRIV